MKKLLYFTADSCGPCRMFGPIVDEVSSIYPVEKINVANAVELAKRYNIQNIPTVILVENGNEILRKVGVQTKQVLLDLFK